MNDIDPLPTPALNATPMPTTQASDAADAAQPTSPSPAAAAAPAKVGRRDQALPVLEQLFALYPSLFGERFLPLKLGVFQDLLAANPQVFERATLKLALGVHTRSTRYLQAVANGLPRHDLQGQPTEPVAPEHVVQAVVELYARRKAKAPDEARERLHKQLTRAYRASALPRGEFLARLGALDDELTQSLDAAMDEADQQRARDAALAQAFAASGLTVQAFALSVGVPVGEVRAALGR